MYNKNFFPTPEVLIDKMFSKIKFNKIRYILEPSAGKGNIINALKEKTKNYNCLIDAIEIEKDLQHILKGNKINIVFNDFLHSQHLRARIPPPLSFLARDSEAKVGESTEKEGV